MGNKSFQEVIKSYLDERAKTDELFAESYAKKNKSIKECCAYIMGEARKRGSAVAISDTEVFGMAVHYYDEDDIKVSKAPASAKVSAPSDADFEISEEDKNKAREAALKRLEEEQYALLKKKPSRAKKEDSEVKQMSLF